MKNCPKCGSKHNKPGKFCSRSCANSRGPRTEKFKELVRDKLSGRKALNPNPTKGKYLVERVAKICPCCGTEFLTTIAESKKYCSGVCWRQSSGGYREGSGRAKAGYYNGIYCGSTYELVWTIYNIDHQIQFSRFPGVLEKDGIKYYPDFLIENTIIEIKGYERQESVNKKTKVAESFGYSVVVLRKEDLTKEFEWVKQNYLYKDLYELYDEFKPAYNLKCAQCGEVVTRNKKPKTDYVFCSRKCAGKGHKGKVNKSL